MSTGNLTERELEYLNCDVPMISRGSAAARLTAGIIASVFQAAFTPGNGKADRGLMRTVREMRYTKYKKAVLRKQEGKPGKNDAKILDKLNKKEFILAEDTYDPDEFTRQVYEEYMNKNEESGMRN